MCDVKYLRQKSSDFIHHSFIHTSKDGLTLYGMDAHHMNVYDPQGQLLFGPITIPNTYDASCNYCFNDACSMIFIGYPYNECVHVYRYDGISTCVLVQELTCASSFQGSLFGFSLCCSPSGDKVFIGTNIHHYLKSNVYKYETNGEGVFVKDANFQIKTGQPNLLSNFGSSLWCCNDANTLLVCSDHVTIKTNHNTNEVHGQLKVFESSSQGWVFTQQLISNTHMTSSQVVCDDNRIVFCCDSYMYVYQYTNHLYFLTHTVEVGNIHALYTHPVMKYFYVQKQNRVDVYDVNTWKASSHSIVVAKLLLLYENNDHLMICNSNELITYKGKYKHQLKQETKVVVKHGKQVTLSFVSLENKKPKYSEGSQGAYFSLKGNTLIPKKHGKCHVQLLFEEDDTHYQTTHKVPVKIMHHRYPGHKRYFFLSNFFNKIEL